MVFFRCGTSTMVGSMDFLNRNPMDFAVGKIWRVPQWEIWTSYGGRSMVLQGVFDKTFTASELESQLDFDGCSDVTVALAFFAMLIKDGLSHEVMKHYFSRSFYFPILS